MFSDIKAIDQEFPAFFASMIFILGTLVGSFLNVCIYRIPAKKSIVHPGSTCDCGKPIKWYDNIPIFSWYSPRQSSLLQSPLQLSLSIHRTTDRWALSRRVASTPARQSRLLASVYCADDLRHIHRLRPHGNP
jgi:hypothetical protein